jgi:mannan endo-1,4-beta-mannosidase
VNWGSFHRASKYRLNSEVNRTRYVGLRKMRAHYRILWATVLLAVLVLAPLIFVVVQRGHNEITPRCASSRFITALGSTLCAGGRLTHLSGYNWHWIGTGCQAPTDEQIEQVFSQIQMASRANIVRTAFFQSGSNGGSYTDFDRYIAAAKRHNLYILPILVNQWTSCEPSRATKATAWYWAGYTQADDGYPLSYRDYVRRLVAHYATEPTIAFWQLVNEPDAPGAGCGAQAAQALRAFADDMVSVIQSVDPHHLVDLGAPGSCAGDTPTDYQTIVAGSVEVADVWHDYHRVTIPVPSSLRQRIPVLQRLHKPFFVGESGICADVTSSGSCSGIVSAASLAQRASFFDAKLCAGLRAGLSGYIIWSKGSRSVQDDVGAGDPTEKVLAQYAPRAAPTASTHRLPDVPMQC